MTFLKRISLGRDLLHQQLTFTVKLWRSTEAVIFNMAGTILLVALFSLFSAAYSANYECQGVAQYELTFYGMWSNMTHPNAFPFSPKIGRFSPLVGASLRSDPLWMSGMTASEGVKNVAESGK